MPRLRIIAALAVAGVLAPAGVASAGPAKVAGGSTRIAITGAVTAALSNHHLTVTPIAPGTAAGSTFTFPISGGTVNTTSLHGTLRLTGGLVISNGTRTVRLRRLTLVSSRNGTYLLAARRGGVCHVATGRRRTLRVCVTPTHAALQRIATLSAVTVSGDSATATVALTAFSAALVDRLAGAPIASAGTVLGTVTVTPQLG